MPEYRGAQARSWRCPTTTSKRFRCQALADGKRLLVFTYGMLRGVVLLDGDRSARRTASLAATLDGMERFGAPVLSSSCSLGGPIDLLVTGAAAVSREGVHFGKGHGYLDLEWGLLVGDGPSRPGDSGDRVGSRLPGRRRAGPLCRARRHRGRDRHAERGPAMPTAAKAGGLVWDRMPREFAATRPYIKEVTTTAQGRRSTWHELIRTAADRGRPDSDSEGRVEQNQTWQRPQPHSRRGGGARSGLGAAPSCSASRTLALSTT